MNQNNDRPAWVRSPLPWLIAAVIGALLCAVAYWMWPEPFLRAHLVAVVVWTGISVGALLLLMLYSLVGGKWGILLRPSLVSAVQPLWLLALAFLPIALQLETLYPWTHWERGTTAEHLWAKSPYLNESMFYVRAIAYWVLWIVGAWIATLAFRASTRQQPAWTARWHAVGLPLLVISVTFASVDWWMSLEPQWSSSAYGILILAGQGAAALAMAILVSALSQRATPPPSPDAPGHQSHHPISPWRDVGNLLLAAICLWMYISYTQYLIIWSGNLPEEATWYLARGHGLWKWVAVTLVAGHFAIPFMILLSSNVKKNPRQLAIVASLVLATHFLEALWLVLPAFESPGWETIALYVLALASIGAAWFFVFVFRYRNEIAMPVE